jgi:hypothetical protein
MSEGTISREAQGFYESRGTAVFNLASVSPEQKQRFEISLEGILEAAPWEVIEYRGPSVSAAEDRNRRDVLRQKIVGTGNEDWGGGNAYLYVEEREFTQKVRKSLFRPFIQEPWHNDPGYHIQFGVGRAEPGAGRQKVVDIKYAVGGTEVVISGDETILQGLGFGYETDSVDVVCDILDFLWAKTHGQPVSTNNDYLKLLV